MKCSDKHCFDVSDGQTYFKIWQK